MPKDRIIEKELYTVVTLVPRRRTVFYHKACGPKKVSQSAHAVLGGLPSLGKRH
jgi:hypothetical protein